MLKFMVNVVREVITFHLEVDGAAGAVWGPSEVVWLRTAENEVQW